LFPRLFSLDAPESPRHFAPRARFSDAMNATSLVGLTDMYCTGELLAAVQRAGIWSDSKDFVDTPIKHPHVAGDVLMAWRRYPWGPDRDRWRDGPERTDDEVRAFVAKYFEAGPARPVEGGEVDVDDARATLPDWDPDGPAFARHLADPKLREFARRVHALWPSLARPPATDPPATDHPGWRSTLLPLPRAAIVPGERFRETYYWDSYWTALGLLASGMRSTAAGVCENMLSLVDAHGFMPNGARVYYLNRSQPPVLASTVAAVCGVGGGTAGGVGGTAGGVGGIELDAALAARSLPTLTREWEYLTGPRRTVRVRSRRDPTATHAMYRYWAYTDEPRPESWREDVEVCANCESIDAKRRIYRDVASAAESGHDFGSRWLATAGEDEVAPGETSVGERRADPASLASIRTTRIVPADLNGFMLRYAADVAAIARAVNDDATAARFESEANRIRVALREVLWDEETGRWRDLLLSDWDEDDWDEVPLVRFDSQQRVAVGLHDAIIAGLRADPTQVLHNSDFIDELEAMVTDSPYGRLLPEPWVIYLHDLHRKMCEKRERNKRERENRTRDCRRDIHSWWLDEGTLGRARKLCEQDMRTFGKGVTFATNKITGHYNKTAVDLYLGFFDSSLASESVHTKPWDVWAGDREDVVRADDGFVPGTRASDWIPLWCGAVEAGSREAILAVDALRNSGLVLPGGIATSLAHTGHQWDYPNAWAPLVHALCEGCDAFGGDAGGKLARDVATRWVRGNASALERTGYMHEKYDARNAQAGAGGGGEYSPQRGFGWSNGVALHFLRRYFAAGNTGGSWVTPSVGHSESTHSLPDGVMRP